MKKVLSIILFLSLSVVTFIVSAQQNSYNYPFQNPSLSLEEQVMQILWEMDEGLVKDIRDRFGDPKPASKKVVFYALISKGLMVRLMLNLCHPE